MRSINKFFILFLLALGLGFGSAKANNSPNFEAILKNAAHFPPTETAVNSILSDMSTMYTWTNVDTLEYNTGPSKHLAMLRDGSDYIFLDTYGENPDNAGNVGIGGYILSRWRISGGKLTMVKEGQPSKAGFVEPHGIAYNRFVKTEYGYVVCGPEILSVFGPDLEPIQKLHSPNARFIAAEPLKGSSEIAMLLVPSGTLNLKVVIYDYIKNEWTTHNQQVIASDRSLTLSGVNNRLIQTTDGNLFITLNTNNDVSRQIFGKFDLAKLRAGKPIAEFMLWQKNYPVQLEDITIDANNMMHAVVRLGGESYEEKLQYVHANTNVATADDFNASIKGSYTESWEHSSINGVNVTQLPSGNVLAIGIGSEKYGNQLSMAFTLYGSDMKLIKQYRLPTPFETMDQTNRKYGRYGGYHSEAVSCPVVYSDRCIVGGLPYKSTESILKDPKMFFDYDMGSYGMYQVWQGATKDELYIMTALAIQKVNLTKSVLCTQKAEAFDRVAYEKGARGAVEDDQPSTPSKPTATTTASKPATTTTVAKNTTIKIVNDLSSDQNGKYGQVKLAFNGGSRATTTLQKGKTLEIDCEDVKAVYAGVEQNTSWGKLLFKTEGKCGKTINLSSVW